MARYIARYGSMRFLGLFTPARGEEYRRGERVLLRTERGQEVGEILSEATDNVLEKTGELPRGQISRLLADEDRWELARQQSLAPQEFATCKEHIASLGLPMKLVDVERLLGGERVVVYFLSEDRVDFRDLVKKLAAQFATRIEMRQIGVRDEAKLLADYGDCGKPVCCNTHLSEMPPVSMRMAKLQKTTLDPAKISGRCGRLKCCLRYEFDTYVDMQRELPPQGADVITKRGRGRVVGQEILAAQILVEMEDRRRILIDSEEIVQVLSNRRGSRGDGGAGPREEFDNPAGIDRDGGVDPLE